MTADDFRRLVAAGLSTDQIAVVMDMMAARDAERVEADEKRKADQRARWRKWKHGKDTANVSQREQTLANNSREGVTRVEDKTSNSEIEPQEENKKRERALAAFAEFWTAYPNKTGKPVAQRSYLKAIRSTPPEVILDGLRRYIASKPPDRPWLNPSTFLNQERWADQPAVVVPMARGSPSQRPIESLIDSLVSRMDDADANATTQIEGYPAAPRRLSAG